VTPPDYRYLFLPLKATLTMVHISGIGKIYQNDAVLVKKTLKAISIEVYKTFKLSPMLTHSDYRYLFLPLKATLHGTHKWYWQDLSK
jgi:hypothetical protein